MNSILGGWSGALIRLLRSVDRHIEDEDEFEGARLSCRDGIPPRISIGEDLGQSARYANDNGNFVLVVPLTCGKAAKLRFMAA